MCMECDCRLEQVYQRVTEIKQAESLLTPEIRAEIVETVAVLLAKLVETGPAIDPQIRKAWRAQLHTALTQLGIDPTKDHWGILYGEMIYELFHDRQFPKKPAGYPELAPFSAKVQELVAEHNSTLGDLRGRGGKELAGYLYGLGYVLASRLSYEFIFPATDPIVVYSDGEILGRHRYLTLTVLEELGFDTGHWRWVRVERQRGK